MKISYGITVCDELVEIKNLLPFLLKNKREEDEIVVLVDLTKNKPTSEVLGYLHKLSSNGFINLIEDNFNGHFADWKNSLMSYCTGDYIVNIDADEIPHINLINYLPSILESNPDVDIIRVPRINTVSGIGLSHVKKWGWNISKLESQIGEKGFDLDNPQDLDEYNLLKHYNLIIEEIKVKYYIPIINWEDYQMRIYRNNPSIRWKNKLHEVLEGHKSETTLPSEEEWCLYHHKKINKQEKQNNYYNTL